MIAERNSRKLESDLTGPVSSWLEEQGYLVRTEFHTNWGRCDLVGLKPNEEAISERLGLGQRSSIGSLKNFLLLEHIPDLQKSTHLKTLVKRLQDYLSFEEVEEIVERLVRKKFLTQPKKNFIQKRYSWGRIESEILAIELKLNRIREVILQASNNQLFSDRSYIGLPEETVNRLLKKSSYTELVQLGVGLISISNDCVRVILEPIPNATNTNVALRSHSAERFWQEISRDRVS